MLNVDFFFFVASFFFAAFRCAYFFRLPLAFPSTCRLLFALLVRVFPLFIGNILPLGRRTRASALSDLTNTQQAIPMFEAELQVKIFLDDRKLPGPRWRLTLALDVSRYATTAVINHAVKTRCCPAFDFQLSNVFTDRDLLYVYRVFDATISERKKWRKNS